MANNYITDELYMLPLHGQKRNCKRRGENERGEKNQNPLKLQGRELKNDYLLINIINFMKYKLVLELLTKGVIIFTHVKLNNTKKLMGFTRSSVNIIIKFRDPNSSDLEVI